MRRGGRRRQLAWLDAGSTVTGNVGPLATGNIPLANLLRASRVLAHGGDRDVTFMGSILHLVPVFETTIASASVQCTFFVLKVGYDETDQPLQDLASWDPFAAVPITGSPQGLGGSRQFLWSRAYVMQPIAAVGGTGGQLGGALPWNYDVCPVRIKAKRRILAGEGIMLYMRLPLGLANNTTIRVFAYWRTLVSLR